MNDKPLNQTSPDTAASLPLRGLAAVIFLAALFASTPRFVSAELLTPAWVELGPNGSSVARIVVNAPADCPSIQIDGTTQKMTLRQPQPPGFRPACELAIPAGARSATVNGQALVLPQADPTRILAFGDTGCRIKALAIQDCNDPDKWPFKEIASQAASEKAQLMIHVGDYLYRESPCPVLRQSFCGGSPEGDTWDAWNADFFAPAAKLLAAVPWVFTRGNHEDCTRSWRGWFYYLDPRPWNGLCEDYTKPYTITLGKFQLVMLDSSATEQSGLDEKDQVVDFTSQLLSLHPQNAWLVDHHPFWGFASAAFPIPPIPIDSQLEDAWNRANPTGYSLVLSGHVHLFEVVNMDGGRPPQLVVGDGGTSMAEPIRISLKGVAIKGQVVAGDETEQEFGYTLFTKSASGWDFVLKDRAGAVLESCQVITGGAASCKPTSGK
jgi:hypothetical protein